MKNDSAVNTKTFEVVAENLATAIRERGLTVERLVALAYDPAKKVFLLTHVNVDIKVQDKMDFTFIRSNLPSILTWAKVNGVYMFETINMEEATLKAISPWIKALDGVRDTQGNVVDEIYFVGANANIAHQHVLMPDGKILTNAKIGNVRYNRKNNTLFGVKRHDTGVGMGIMTANADIVNKPDMFNRDFWTNVDAGKFEGPIVNISRVRTTDGVTRFTTSFLGGLCCAMELKVVDRKIVVNRGETYKTPYIVLGTLFGHADLYVGYSYDEHNVIVAFNKTAKLQPFAA